MNRLASYTIGLISALLLTSAAFAVALVHTGVLPGTIAANLVLPIIFILAFVQLAVQLFFFLHLGLSKEARWSTVMFVYTFIGIFMVVVASVWIMYHLNYNMTPQQMNQYNIDQSSL